MDPVTRLLMQGAAGAAGAKLYVEDVFQTWLYTGNGSTQTITNGIDLAGKGGLVWMKSRSTTGNNYTVFNDSGTLKDLYTNGTTGAGTATWTSWNNDGFSLSGVTNGNGDTYASWTFRKQAKFFDVVTYTGNGSNRTIAHNLGSVPGCIIVKRTDTTGDWQVYHRSLANTEYLVLNTTAAKATGTTRWNSTTPTSTEFSLGTDATVNASGGTYVAYLFAHDAGGFGDSGNDSVVKCGSFTCDASGNVGTVNLGWEPQWILVKQSSTTGSWRLYDNMRGWGLKQLVELVPNTAAADYNRGAVDYIYPTATGFEGSGNFFGGNVTCTYIAIRRGPMKTPTDATKVFSANTASTTEGTVVSTGFPIDLQVNKYRPSDSAYWVDRLRGVSTTDTTGNLPALSSTSTAAESNNTLTRDWGSTGFDIPTYYNNASTVFWSFRRAPGFFDVVAYTGTGVARTVSHNLGVAPELMIVKLRSSVSSWQVYFGDPSKSIVLNDVAAEVAGGLQRWNSTAPTSTVFSLGTNTSVNANGSTYIAYLFASCPGVSKVGSYTGTGTTLSVDCGFTAGARFVLIKRTDSTGDWYVWDSARGIVAGNDPYLLLNSTAAEVTNTDYVDTYSAGFEISSTAPAAINANGGSFIFLAVA